MSDQISKQFPDLVLSQILTRLPAKNLCRFKLVSKRWNFLISHPNFLTSYISLNPPTWLILDRVIKLDVSDSPDSAIQPNFTHPPNITTLSIDIDHLAIDPISFNSDGKKKSPSVVGSSNGLLLLSLISERDPHVKNKEPVPFPWMHQGIVFVVVNPVTRQWTPLPRPPQQSLDKTVVTCLGTIGFVTRPHPIKPSSSSPVTCETSNVTCEVVVAMYQPDLMTKDGSATILCFSSETSEWVEKQTEYMLGPHFWRSDSTFDFDQRLFWVDLSVGIITWDVDDGDIFLALSKKKKNYATCRYIPLPEECVRRCVTADEVEEDFKRWVGAGGGGGCIQYVEGSEEDRCTRVWKLKDYKQKDGGGWSLMHKVEFSKDGGPGTGRVPMPCFIHPMKEDVAWFVIGGWIFVVDYKGGRLVYHKPDDSCLGGVFLQVFVSPPWPVFLSPSFCAAQWKELGNQFFKVNRVTEAICYYSKSIALSPSAAAYGNRAIAHIKLNRFREAEDDCTQALILDAAYCKVYARRAIARKELRDLVGSLEDMVSALKLEPESGDWKAQHAEVQSLLEKVRDPK